MDSTEFPARILDVDYYALERAYQLIQPELTKEQSDGNVGILDINSSRMLFVVMRQGEMIHVHHQHYAVKGITNLIRNYFESITKHQEESTNSNLVSEEFSDIQKQQLLDQIQYVLKTFGPDDLDHKISKLILSGRALLIPSLENLIKSHCNIDTLLANPFRHMSRSLSVDHRMLEHFAPACLLACGLAMRNLS